MKRARAAKGGAALKGNEIVFALAVTGFAAVFAGLSLSRARKAAPSRPDAGRDHIQSAGRPRDLDIGRLKYLLQQGVLSDHEADPEFYRRITPLPEARPEAPQQDRTGAPVEGETREDAPSRSPGDREGVR